MVIICGTARCSNAPPIPLRRNAGRSATASGEPGQWGYPLEFLGVRQSEAANVCSQRVLPTCPHRLLASTRLRPVAHRLNPWHSEGFNNIYEIVDNQLIADGEVGVAWYSRRKVHLPGGCKLLSQRRICSNLNRKGSKRESSSSIFFAILSMNPMNRGLSRCVWEQQSMRTSSL